MGNNDQALREVIRLFLCLGFTAFGGPATHIAMMHDEVVVRRRWMEEQHFLDLVGATNLIPGPNSTEIRKSPWTAAFLDGVNAAALGLMAGVTWQLGRAALVDLPTILIALVAAFLLFRFKINSAWLVLAGGIIGLALAYLA